jgi:hypothetical protein
MWNASESPIWDRAYARPFQSLGTTGFCVERASGATLDAHDRLGGIAQLDHPNFHYAADAPLITALSRDGLALLEIANGSWDSNDNPADENRPSSEPIRVPPIDRHKAGAPRFRKG